MLYVYGRVDCCYVDCLVKSILVDSEMNDSDKEFVIVVTKRAVFILVVWYSLMWMLMKLRITKRVLIRCLMLKCYQSGGFTH